MKYFDESVKPRGDTTGCDISSGSAPLLISIKYTYFMSISKDTCLGFSKDPSLGDSSFEYHKRAPDLRHGEKKFKIILILLLLLLLLLFLNLVPRIK